MSHSIVFFPFNFTIKPQHIYVPISHPFLNLFRAKYSSGINLFVVDFIISSILNFLSKKTFSNQTLNNGVTLFLRKIAITLAKRNIYVCVKIYKMYRTNFFAILMDKIHKACIKYMHFTSFCNHTLNPQHTSQHSTIYIMQSPDYSLQHGYFLLIHSHILCMMYLMHDEAQMYIN